MRRKDREITDPRRIRQIMDRCTHCRLGLYDGQEVYIVPMNFGYEVCDGSWTLWFHCAGQGRKLDILRENPRVGFQMDGDYTLVPHELACECSARFASIVGIGTVERITDPDGKRKGLTQIMNHTAGTRAWHFSEDAVERVTVLKLTVDKLSCKATG